jgi:hypothetical protein
MTDEPLIHSFKRLAELLDRSRTAVTGWCQHPDWTF